MAPLSYSSKNIVHARACQAPPGQSQYRATPTVRDLFIASKPWQYGVTKNDSRKYQLVDERMRRLAKVLSRVDWTGACREIFPAVATIRAMLVKAELNYPEHLRMKWSRRTVFVYLKRLEKAEVMTREGLTGYHGTRRRALHPERLLSAPRESCTSTRRESCTGSKSLKSLGSKKIHKTKRAPDKPDPSRQPKPLPQRRASTKLPPIATEPGRPAPTNWWETAFRAFDVLAYQNTVLPDELAGRICWILYRALMAGGSANTPRSITYYVKSCEHFNDLDENQQRAFLEEAEVRLLKLVAHHRRAQLEVCGFLSRLKIRVAEAGGSR